MYKAVIFDFFDVIHRDHQKAWLAEHGFKREGGFAEASDLLDRGAIDFKEYLRRYSELSGKTQALVRKQFAELAKLDEGVVSLIRELKKRYNTGLLSNSHAEELRPILNRHNLIELFDEIVISSEVAISKPDEKIFHLILKRLGSEPHEAVFIDDNPHNVEAAGKLGINGIVFQGVDSLKNELQHLGIQNVS